MVARPIWMLQNKFFSSMFIRRKKNRSGTTSVVVADKSEGFKNLHTVGISSDPKELEEFILLAQEWIDNQSGQMPLFSSNTEESDKKERVEFAN